jgi:hypothetical protein
VFTFGLYWPPARPGHAPQQAQQAQVQQPMAKLGAAARLEVGQQIELAAVVASVTGSTQCNAAVGVVAAAERARHEV